MENTQNQEAPIKGDKGSKPPPPRLISDPALAPIDWTRRDIIILDDDGEVD